MTTLGELYLRDRVTVKVKWEIAQWDLIFVSRRFPEMFSIFVRCRDSMMHYPLCVGTYIRLIYSRHYC